jgi:plastocyanin
MNTSTLLGLIIVILIILGGGWWYYNNQMVAAPADQTQNTGGTNPNTGTNTGAGINVGGSVSTAPSTASITYSADGFTPGEVTIKRGGTVTWTNSSGSNMWVASAQHPTHMVYSGTSRTEHCDDTVDISFDQCENGSSYSFTFTRAGTWAYHNHSNATHFGRVIVVE